ncbi:MAG: hypothetical protein AAFU70_12715, partial [Planctomycetota bacterium]
RGIPLVVSMMVTDRAAAAVRALEQAGVSAFAPTRTQLAGVKPAVEISRVIPTADESRFVVERPDGAAAELRLDRVFLVVRAVLKFKARVVTDNEIVSYDEDSGVIGIDWSGGGGTRSQVVTTEVVELHTMKGQRIRVDMRRLDEKPLGLDTLAPHRERADILTELFMVGAKHAMLDLGFKRFRIPPDLLQRSRKAGTQEGFAVSTFDGGIPFEFYSVWTQIMHRRMLGLDAS